jgi:hypothetical protein
VVNDKKIKAVAREIAQEFEMGLGNLKLSAAEGALVDRASERIAKCGILAIGATPAALRTLAIERDLSLATLANVGVAKAIDAENLMREVALRVILRFVKAGLAIAVA